MLIQWLRVGAFKDSPLKWCCGVRYNVHSFPSNWISFIFYCIAQAPNPLAMEVGAHVTHLIS